MATTERPSTPHATHEVINQPPPLAEDLALALQASLLVRDAPGEVASGFCTSRLGGQGGRAYGTLPDGIAAEAIVERALAL